MTPRIVLEAWQEGCHDAGRGGHPASHGLKLCDAASVYESSRVVSGWQCYILINLLRLYGVGETRFLLASN